MNCRSRAGAWSSTSRDRARRTDLHDRYAARAACCARARGSPGAHHGWRPVRALRQLARMGAHPGTGAHRRGTARRRPAIPEPGTAETASMRARWSTREIWSTLPPAISSISAMPPVDASATEAAAPARAARRAAWTTKPGSRRGGAAGPRLYGRITRLQGRMDDDWKLQRVIVDALEDVKGQDIRSSTRRALTDMFDRVVIASGTSNRQTRALASSVAREGQGGRRRCRQHRRRRHRRMGAGRLRRRGRACPAAGDPRVLQPRGNLGWQIGATQVLGPGVDSE